MSKSEAKEDRTYDILVYGVEKVGLTAPKEPLRTRNFHLFFEPYNTNRRFNEFNGVVSFQGIFESFEWKSGVMESYLKHSCDKDELDKRKKEAQLLLGNGGFLCFLLNKPFIDSEQRRDFRASDLTKYHLNYPNFYRDNFEQRIAHLDIKLDEFRRFLDIYGAATSHFRNFNESIEWRVIAEVANRVAGMIINRNEYFIPILVPDNRPEVVGEYFTLLAEALTSTHNKLHQELPDWIEAFTIAEEEGLAQERASLEVKISDIDQRKDKLNRYKSILVLSGDELVASVARVFYDGFGISVDTTDELREDFKLLDNQAQPFCLCEVKGTNKGVKREYINQADSHRERSGYGENSPALLIINTHIKNARSIIEKDQDIAHEQVLHAVKMNILVLRTIDLLGLLRLYLKGTITLDETKNILTGNGGWLRVRENEFVLITGKESETGA